MTNLSLSRAAWLLMGPLLISAADAGLAAEEPQIAAVRRYDPRNRSFVSVAATQIQPGKIYNHLSQRQGRYVWAYAKVGGGFDYALGIGSTELPSNFDLVTSSQQTKKLLEDAAGTWFERSQQEGSTIFVRLGADNVWHVASGRTIRSHYDLNTGRRWEWHGNQRAAVVHTNGYRWTTSGDRYLPANPWNSSTFWYDTKCNSSPLSGVNSR